jgi:hypothetical protein
MTVENSRFFIFLLQCGFEETTSRRFPGSYIEILLGQYDPRKHIRIFTKGKIEVYFDLTECRIIVNRKWIMSCFISDGFIGFDRKQELLAIPEDVLDYLQFGRVIKSRYIPSKIKSKLFERDGGICQECGDPYDIEIDHIKPVSKGGTSTLNNLQLLCKPCNRKKRDKY